MNESDGGVDDSTPLVVLIAHGPLRSWVVEEVASDWRGQVHLVDRYPDIFQAVRDAGDRPAVLICGEQLATLTQYYGRRWMRLTGRATVVLVESVDNAELVSRLLRYVDGVLLRELHQGIATEIVQSARSGIRAFPAEMIDRLIQRRASDALRPANGEEEVPGEAERRRAEIGPPEAPGKPGKARGRDDGVGTASPVGYRGRGIANPVVRLKEWWRRMRRG